MIEDAPPGKGSALEDRYRTMTKAAPALFSATGMNELGERLAEWAAKIFPEAEFYLQKPDPEDGASASPTGPSEEVHMLAAEALIPPSEMTGDRVVLWMDPSARSQPRNAPHESSLPSEVALISLAPQTGPRRTALLVYPSAPPLEREREAAEAFAELAREAASQCSARENPDPENPDPTGELIQVVNSIASQLELSEVMQVVAEKASRLLNADRSSVWVYEEDEEELFTLVAQKLESEEIRMSAEQGVAGRVLRTGDPVNVIDAYEHPNFNPTYDRETGYRTQSMLCTPLRNKQGETLGVFQVINKQTGDRFTEEDEALLEALANSAAVALENAMLYEEQKEQFDSFIQVLATTIDSRDPMTGAHTVMVTGIAVLIAQEMDLDPSTIEKIRVAGILHDVGKVVLPDKVLLKEDDLTEEEYEIAQRHVVHTIQILDHIHFHRELEDVPQIAGAHHERLNGDGYPKGLSAEDLSVPMRILAVADVFHALLQARPYKESHSMSEAIEECRRIAGLTPNAPEEARDPQLDPEVVEALIQNIEREGTDDFRERVVERSGFEEKNVFDPDANLPA